MAYIASCLQELLPFDNGNSLFIQILAIAGASVSYGHISSCLISFLIPQSSVFFFLQLESLAKKTGEMKINPVKEKLSRKKKKLHTEKMLEEVSYHFNLHMGLVLRKPVFGGLRTTQAQTSLVSAFVSRFLESFICKLATGEISFF